MANTDPLRRVRRYLPQGSVDADDLRQELALAELMGVDGPTHVWNVLRRHLRRAETEALGGHDAADRYAGDDVAARDLLGRLNMDDGLRAEVEAAYETGEYGEWLRRDLSVAAAHLRREDHL